MRVEWQHTACVEEVNNINTEYNASTGVKHDSTSKSVLVNTDQPSGFVRLSLHSMSTTSILQKEVTKFNYKTNIKAAFRFAQIQCMS